MSFSRLALNADALIIRRGLNSIPQVPVALAQPNGGIKGKRPSKKDKLRQVHAGTVTASGSIASIASIEHKAASTAKDAEAPAGDEQTQQNPKN